MAGALARMPSSSLPQLLREHVALPAAGRAPVPLVVGRPCLVIRRGDFLGEQDLLLHPVADEVVDELEVVGTVGVNAGLQLPPTWPVSLPEPT